MPAFKSYIPIQVRYGDIDPQWHVNHTRFLTYMEHARMTYMVERGLFDGRSFFDFKLILADLHISYLAPIFALQKVKVGMRVARLGTKSLDIHYQVEDEVGGSVLAKAETIMVMFDYHINASLPVPSLWRERISEFEGIPPGPTPAPFRKFQ